MKTFTAGRGVGTPDEIWLVEHEPVYTLGQAGKPEHVLNPGQIPLVKTDRGGQVTYHGPGQVVAYCLVDLRRLGLFVKEYVELLEAVVIDVLGEFGLADACRKAGAPGVYVPWPCNALAVSAASPAVVPGRSVLAEAAGHAETALPGGHELAKIAALGVKISRGCAYHGIALNVAMDLTPFLGINPCGYAGLRTVDLAACGVVATVTDAGNRLASRLDAAFDARQGRQTRV
ncbi:MAG: lipoyl(octanoyl) transferase LipB [Alcaligenaceae bacterium]|nr:lipoyl(octanoyl) transferase LipB [Alcaligenaceae bacterium]